ncbi:SDR family NAD(P)-dependent oxidoreductase [Uliginosibacterium sp. sgz301328]|uniref:SDR family NAD(P)-dependent oxidoreductase n=1 Tax=Uliginosibacterium sp. sgz301328 TaxID=3243764 RepID=UPI00359E7C24
MGSLTGKRALITGAEQGIGKAVAEGLLKAGCDIAIHYFSGEEGPQELVALAQSLGRKAQYFQADLTHEAAAVEMVHRAVSFLGGLDVLVNNVGGLVERRHLEAVDMSFWKKVIDINLTTMMLVTREAVPHLAKSGGASIVNLASLAGRKGGHGGSLVYSMTKGAVLTLTRALSAELGPQGIRVNAVAPGLILGTRFHNVHTTRESADETIRGIPLGRAGDVQDVARPIVFLASEYDGFVTGETIDINGGVYCA